MSAHRSEMEKTSPTQGTGARKHDPGMDRLWNDFQNIMHWYAAAVGALNAGSRPSRRRRPLVFEQVSYDIPEHADWILVEGSCLACHKSILDKAARDGMREFVHAITRIRLAFNASIQNALEGLSEAERSKAEHPKASENVESCYCHYIINGFCYDTAEEIDSEDCANGGGACGPCVNLPVNGGKQ